jgi:hypothetical protein
MPDVIFAEAVEANKQEHLAPSDRTASSAAGAATPPTRARTSASAEPGQKRMIPFETLWDAKDVAAHLKCSESWVYKHAEKGTLPCVRYGGLLRFEPDAIRQRAKRPVA